MLLLLVRMMSRTSGRIIDWCCFWVSFSFPNRCDCVHLFIRIFLFWISRSCSNRTNDESNCFTTHRSAGYTAKKIQKFSRWLRWCVEDSKTGRKYCSQFCWIQKFRSRWHWNNENGQRDHLELGRRSARQWSILFEELVAVLRNIGFSSQISSSIKDRRTNSRRIQSINWILWFFFQRKNQL